MFRRFEKDMIERGKLIWFFLMLGCIIWNTCLLTINLLAVIPLLICCVAIFLISFDFGDELELAELKRRIKNP